LFWPTRENEVVSSTNKIVIFIGLFSALVDKQEKAGMLYNTTGNITKSSAQRQECTKCGLTLSFRFLKKKTLSLS